MELFTLNRKFLKQDQIDEFISAIWTERYYGNSEVELVVPATTEMIQKLPVGTFLSLTGTNEVMIIESSLIEDGSLKVTGISLLPWLNNRFVRATASQKDQYWILGSSAPGETPGWILWAIVYYMCVEGSAYLTGVINTGIPNPQRLAIPGLGLKDYDKSGQPISVSVPYGPVYDALLEIATAYKIGMQITLESADEFSYSLGFRSYKGLNRTSGQTQNPPVRFSPQMESFTDIKEIQSIAPLKTLVFTFAPNVPDSLATAAPGVAQLSVQYTGFDLRALMQFATDISTNPDELNADQLAQLLSVRAHQAIVNSPFIKTVDGEIVPTSQFQYDVHYTLGDLIEVQGNSEIIQVCRVVEYIRAQDEAGERAYPTVAVVDEGEQ